MRLIKEYGLTGLVLFFPLFFTLIIAYWLFNLITSPLANILFKSMGSGSSAYPNLAQFLEKLLSLSLLLSFIALIGFLGKRTLFSPLISHTQTLFRKIPFFNRIFHASHEVVDTLLRENDRGFSQVVSVRHPSTLASVVGFIPRKDIPICPTLFGNDLIPVFIPGCPNPLMGFILFFRKEDVIPLNLKVEEAFKWHISLGAVVPNSFKNQIIEK